MALRVGAAQTGTRVLRWTGRIPTAGPWEGSGTLRGSRKRFRGRRNPQSAIRNQTCARNDEDNSAHHCGPMWQCGDRTVKSWNRRYADSFITQKSAVFCGTWVAGSRREGEKGRPCVRACVRTRLPADGGAERVARQQAGLPPPLANGAPLLRRHARAYGPKIWNSRIWGANEKLRSHIKTSGMHMRIGRSWER